MMNRRFWKVTFLAVAVGSGLAAAAFAAGLAAGRQLSAREAQQVLQRALGGRYERDRIRIRRVLPGFSPGDAIVEAQVEATFKLARTARGWEATEVRIADRDWRPLAALTRELSQSQPTEGVTGAP
ncbi:MULTISPECIES: hypothetical protein [Chloracidobacterium]|jgi:hypothetical protein|nr:MULTISPECIES: hypothetical protein [Chloracidobacterium]QUV78255.1 hypothetical protein J8C08_09150 [Chloracidobacterium thermophilum]QUV81296.1 hypothetical protein J8C01_08680 [Chloracidobacterium sp. D]